MRTIPKPANEALSFCQIHLPQWAEHAQDVGTSPEIVAQLAALTEAAKEALSAQRAAQQAAQAATMRAHQAVKEMRNLAQSILLQVRAKAKVTGVGVYTLALVSPPEQGSPIAPPGKPYRFEVELEQLGTLKLTWQCDNPRGSEGTQYYVSRKIGDGPFKFLGSSGKKTFVDTTLPAGTPRVMYEVRAVRTTGAGEVAWFPISLGIESGIPKAMLKPPPTQLTAA